MAQGFETGELGEHQGQATPAGWVQGEGSARGSPNGLDKDVGEVVHNRGQLGISDEHLRGRIGLQEALEGRDHGDPWGEDHEDRGLLQAVDASEASQGAQTSNFEGPRLAENGQDERKAPGDIVSIQLFW